MFCSGVMCWLRATLQTMVWCNSLTLFTDGVPLSSVIGNLISCPTNVWLTLLFHLIACAWRSLSPEHLLCLGLLRNVIHYANKLNNTGITCVCVSACLSVSSVRGYVCVFAWGCPVVPLVRRGGGCQESLLSVWISSRVKETMRWIGWFNYWLVIK